MIHDTNTGSTEFTKSDEWARYRDRFWRDFGALERTGDIHEVDPLWLVIALRVEAEQLEHQVREVEDDALKYNLANGYSWEGDSYPVDRLAMLVEALGQVVEARRERAADEPPF